MNASFALFVASALPLVAQTITGHLAGVVRDPSGAPLSHAIVIAKNSSMSATLSAETNTTGDYCFANLLAGDYSLVVSAAGFSKIELNGIALQPGKTLATSITLTPLDRVEETQAPAGGFKHVAALQPRLALSAAQQVKFRAILENRRSQIAAARDDLSLTGTARRQKIAAIRNETEDEIYSLLNDNQRDEYDEIKRERRDWALQKTAVALK